MAIYVIADLHLSFSQDKPMSIFGENWEGHSEKIKNNWIVFMAFEFKFSNKVDRVVKYKILSFEICKYKKKSECFTIPIFNLKTNVIIN